MNQDKLESHPEMPYFKDQMATFFRLMAKCAYNVGERHGDQMQDQYTLLEI